MDAREQLLQTREAAVAEYMAMTQGWADFVQQKRGRPRKEQPAQRAVPQAEPTTDRRPLPRSRSQDEFQSEAIACDVGPRVQYDMSDLRSSSSPLFNSDQRLATLMDDRMDVDTIGDIDMLLHGSPVAHWTTSGLNFDGFDPFTPSSLDDEVDSVLAELRVGRSHGHYSMRW